MTARQAARVASSRLRGQIRWSCCLDAAENGGLEDVEIAKILGIGVPRVVAISDAGMMVCRESLG
jgi:hypothetical protein